MCEHWSAGLAIYVSQSIIGAWNDIPWERGLVGGSFLVPDQCSQSSASKIHPYKRTPTVVKVMCPFI